PRDLPSFPTRRSSDLGFFVSYPAQMCRHLGNHHFQSGPDSTVQEMTAVRGAVGFTNDHMSVKHRLAIFFYNVPNKGKDFDLFVRSEEHTSELQSRGHL